MTFPVTAPPMIFDLFPDDPLLQDAASVMEKENLSSNLEVNTLLRVLRKLDEKEDLLNKEQDHYVQFFDKKICRLADQRKFLQNKIESFILANDGKAIITPEGTTYLHTREVRSWPGNEELLVFSETHKIPTATEIRPNLKLIKEFCKQEQKYPIGSETHFETTLAIRRNKPSNE